VTPLAPEHCYRALRARDPRFDGVFFVGVETTGVYCRPICPARTPMRARCRFFDRAAAAERAGFRACLRCRPERAPGQAPVDLGPQLVRGSLVEIAAGALDHMSVEALADRFGVTGRHLRRTLEAAVGVTPVELAQSRRLGMAKWLIQDTQLPLTEIAFAAGFSSIRRFNATVAQKFGCPPSALRRPRGTAAVSSPEAARVSLRLEARSPFAGPALLAFLRTRAIPDVEWVTERSYGRWVRHGDVVGRVDAELDPDRSGIIAHIDGRLLAHVTDIVARLRALFDLDARPDLIDAHLARDPRLVASVRRVPGLRVPGAFDGWELAVRAVLGQQISVAGATTISGRLVAQLGTAHALPGPAKLAAAQVQDVAAIGIPRARAATLIALAQRVHDGAIDLSPAAESARTVTALQQVPGVGPWTAQYIALRALRDPDGFLAGDLGVRKALGGVRAAEAEAISQRWRPWRGYALMHLWSGAR
jgi:AraC family transcriptional regulator of adaptative response / DNA-3-methyladenine glycosylase II